MINWFTWISMLIIFVFTISIIHYYAAKSTAYYVYVFVFLGYFLAFALVVLIPYDVYLSIASPSEDIHQRKFELEIIWHIVY